MIIEQTIYLTGGKQFKTREQAEAYRYDQIGITLDKKLSDKGVVLGSKTRLTFVDILTENRELFTRLLDY